MKKKKKRKILVQSLLPAGAQQWYQHVVSYSASGYWCYSSTLSVYLLGSRAEVLDIFVHEKTISAVLILDPLPGTAEGPSVITASIDGAIRSFMPGKSSPDIITNLSFLVTYK